MPRAFLKARDPFSCYSRFVGAVLSVSGLLILLLRLLFDPDISGQLAGAAVVFCRSLIALYSASSVYHFSLRGEAVLRRLKKLDHSMIYVLIAGSYTPFCVVLLPQPRGTQFCLILWGVALAGVLAKMLWINAPRMLSTAVYLIMGWSVVFVAKDFTALGLPCLTRVALGGICYSVGAVFYAVKKPNISAEWTFHELFHLVILAGSFFHYLAVYLYVLRRSGEKSD